jgi:hypothetical protein
VHRPTLTPEKRDLARPAQAVETSHERLDRQAVAALFATSGEDLAAVLRAHPLHETMDALTAAIVGLKCTFHVTRDSERKTPIAGIPR